MHLCFAVKSKNEMKIVAFCTILYFDFLFYIFTIVTIIGNPRSCNAIKREFPTLNYNLLNLETLGFLKKTSIKAINLFTIYYRDVTSTSWKSDFIHFQEILHTNLQIFPHQK